MKNSKLPPGGDFDNAHLSKVSFGKDQMEDILKWYKNPKDFLVISANPGIGKTYFCIALWKALEEKKERVLFNFERDFFLNLRKIIADNWDYEIEIEKIAEMPFLILDDLGSNRHENATPFQKEVWFSLVDQRVMNRLPTVITTNLTFNEIKDIYGERFHSRLTAKRNLVFAFRGEDKRA